MNLTTISSQANSTYPLGSIESWDDFLHEGEAYLKTATAAREQAKKAFTPEILYNIIAMAIEKFVMAALMKHGKMPYNHTMVDLTEAMEETFPGAIADIRDDLLALDSYQDICDPYSFHITIPKMDEIPAMLNVASTLRKLVHQKLI